MNSGTIFERLFNYHIFMMIFMIFTPMISISQNSAVNKFAKLHFAEKIWVMTHPFVAKKASVISLRAYKLAENMISDTDLDSDASGGQVDAFRHTLWMAMLTIEIGAWKSRRLGIAHEKGNKVDFRKKTLEEGNLPCYISCKMDLTNNELGIKIGKEYKNLSEYKLTRIVKQQILEGKAVKIKKNPEGKFLDSSGKIISDSDYIGRWYSPKTLIPSN